MDFNKIAKKIVGYVNESVASGKDSVNVIYNSITLGKTISLVAESKQDKAFVEFKPTRSPADYSLKMSLTEGTSTESLVEAIVKGMKDHVVKEAWYDDDEELDAAEKNADVAEFGDDVEDDVDPEDVDVYADDFGAKKGAKEFDEAAEDETNDEEPDDDEDDKYADLLKNKGRIGKVANRPAKKPMPVLGEEVEDSDGDLGGKTPVKWENRGEYVVLVDAKGMDYVKIHENSFGDDADAFDEFLDRNNLVVVKQFDDEDDKYAEYGDYDESVDPSVEDEDDEDEDDNTDLLKNKSRISKVANRPAKTPKPTLGESAIKTDLSGNKSSLSKTGLKGSTSKTPANPKLPTGGNLETLEQAKTAMKKTKTEKSPIKDKTPAAKVPKEGNVQDMKKAKAAMSATSLKKSVPAKTGHDLLTSSANKFMYDQTMKEYWDEEAGDVETHVLVDGAAGIYVPQRFVTNFEATEWGVSPEDAAVLSAGPDAENYWEVWDDVLATAKYTDKDGKTWSLSQDIDLFAVNQDSVEETEPEVTEEDDTRHYI